MARINNNALLKRIYPFVIAIALFTGFGNMPLYKRYFISDLPGMGWSSNFYINLYIHYLAGALLLGIAVYLGLIHLKIHLAERRLTLTGKIRSGALGLTLLSGILLAIRNLSNVNFGMGPQITVVFLHLGMAMLVLGLSICCGIMKNPWTRKI